MTAEELLKKMYEDIKTIKKEVNEIKNTLLPMATEELLKKMYEDIKTIKKEVNEIKNTLLPMATEEREKKFGCLRKIRKELDELGFGTLGILSIPPLFFVICWARKIRELRFSLFLVIIVFTIQMYFFIQRCNNKRGNEHKKFDPSSFHLGCISIIYGVICFNSCLLGLSIEKRFFLELEFLKSCLVFVSVAVAIYIFVIKNIYELIEKKADSFMLAFISLVLAISFFYVILGNESQSDVLVFMISASLSFLIGFALGILILQFSGILKSFHNHWFFVCILTVFISNLCVVITRQDMTILNLAERVIEFLLGKNVFEWMLTFI